MDKSSLATIISVAAAISGILLGWLGRSRTIRQDNAAEAGKDALLRADMDYIKRGIEDIRVEQKAQIQRYDTLAEKVARMDENLKSAHKRIDKMEAK